MEKYIVPLLNEFVSDENRPYHRFRSWQHCYKFFASELDDSNKEMGALHLAFYLASWGMYRGSTFLLQNDYTIHLDVVEILYANKNSDYTEFAQILKVSKLISAHYENNAHPNATERVVPSDTLITKILLGTTGCIPAYDRFFKTGLQYTRLPQTFSSRGFEQLNAYYAQNEEVFRRFSKDEIPKMKLIDMYFWKLGFEVEKIKREYKGIDKQGILEKLERKYWTHHD